MTKAELREKQIADFNNDKAICPYCGGTKNNPKVSKIGQLITNFETTYQLCPGVFHEMGTLKDYADQHGETASLEEETIDKTKKREFYYECIIYYKYEFFLREKTKEGDFSLWKKANERTM